MDTAEEKSNTLSRCGSFYYNTLVDASKDDAEFISHLTWNSKFPAQLQNIISAVMGRSHFQDFYRLVKFTDADVNWRGMKAALQHRSSVPPSNPQIPDYNNRLPDYILGEGTALESNSMLLGDSESQALIAPKANTWITLPGDTQLFWELNIDDSLFVTTIRTPEGKLWYAGQEYTAQYGKLTFTENPIKLFPDMEFMAESCVVRKPHIYNHMLRLGSVYETPDRILHYYRQAQTPKTFYLAAAQACGLAVIRQDCTIVNRMPLLDGYSYSTTDGIYEAPYKHTALDRGASLTEGYIIGGQELFQLCSPGEPLPPRVTRLNLDNALPVPGLSVTNEEIQIWNANGQYRPAYDGDIDAVEAWYAYLQGVRDDAESAEGAGPVSEPGIEHFRNVACKDRCLVACINEAYMSTEMQLRLMEFLRRELPTGAVLVTATLPVGIDGTVIPDLEPEPEPLPPVPRIARTVDPNGGDPGYGGWRGFSLAVATTADCFEWTTDAPSDKPIFLSEVEMECPSGTPATYTVKLAVYNARTTEFLGVSDAQTFEANTSKRFYFGNIQVPLTDQIVFVFVKATTSTADLLNPISLGLDINDLEDGMIATEWRFKVWELTPAIVPSKWGLIGPGSTGLAPSGTQRYIPVLTLRFIQQV